MMQNILQPIGAIVGGFGLLWQIWNTRANGPGYLIFFGLAALIAGGALS